MGKGNNLLQTVVNSSEILDLNDYGNEVNKLKGQIQGIVSQVEELKNKSKELFPVEKTARTKILELINSLYFKKEILYKKIKTINLFIKKGVSFPCLSLDSLRWRDKDGFPRLAIFSLEKEAIFGFKYSRYWNEPVKIIPDDLPEELVNVYDDVLEMMNIKYAKTNWVSITTTFEGVITDDTRRKIKRNSYLFEKIFIIAEIESWEEIIKEDPIVAGFKGGLFYIIDVFDLTPLENYIKSEFAV